MQYIIIPNYVYTVTMVTKMCINVEYVVHVGVVL